MPDTDWLLPGDRLALHVTILMELRRQRTRLRAIPPKSRWYHEHGLLEAVADKIIDALGASNWRIRSGMPSSGTAPGPAAMRYAEAIRRPEIRAAAEAIHDRLPHEDLASCVWTAIRAIEAAEALFAGASPTARLPIARFDVDRGAITGRHEGMSPCADATRTA